MPQNPFFFYKAVPNFPYVCSQQLQIFQLCLFFFLRFNLGTTGCMVCYWCTGMLLAGGPTGFGSVSYAPRKGFMFGSLL